MAALLLVVTTPPELPPDDELEEADVRTTQVEIPRTGSDTWQMALRAVQSVTISSPSIVHCANRLPGWHMPLPVTSPQAFMPPEELDVDAAGCCCESSNPQAKRKTTIREETSARIMGNSLVLVGL